MRKLSSVIATLALVACGGGAGNNAAVQVPDNARLFVQYEDGAVGAAPTASPAGRPSDKQSYTRQLPAQLRLVDDPKLVGQRSLRLTAPQLAGEVVELRLEAERFREAKSPARLSWIGRTGNLAPISAAFFSEQRQLARIQFSNGNVTVLAEGSQNAQRLSQYQSGINHRFVLRFDPETGKLVIEFEEVGGTRGAELYELPIQVIPETANYKVQFFLSGPANAGNHNYTLDDLQILELPAG